jgi:hypothetical protein
MLTAYRPKLQGTRVGSEEVTVNKNGGILIAKEGDILDIAGNSTSLPDYGYGYAAEVRRKASSDAVAENKLRQDAAALGRTKKQHMTA